MTVSYAVTYDQKPHEYRRNFYLFNYMGAVTGDGSGGYVTFSSANEMTTKQFNPGDIVWLIDFSNRAGQDAPSVITAKSNDWSHFMFGTAGIGVLLAQTATTQITSVSDYFGGVNINQLSEQNPICLGTPMVEQPGWTVMTKQNTNGILYKFMARFLVYRIPR